MQRAHGFSLSPIAFAGLGISIERLCRQAGVVPASTLNTDDFFRLWAAGEQAFPERGAGLHFGSRGIDLGYSVAGMVALHSPDLHHALVALARYKRLTCPELIEIDIGAAEVSVRYRWLQATRAVPRLLVDTTMASLLGLVRRGTGGQVAPLRLELARPPLDQALLADHFGCPIRFDAPHDAMVFAQTALAQPFVNADGGAFALTLAGLEARLAHGEGFPALTGALRVAIARHLSEGRRPGLAAIAHRLGLSVRTLQRRLDGASTSFGEELAQVRRITAGRLLADTQLDMVAIAMLLGFEESNSFARAFRGWEQTSPMRWRARHASLSPSRIPL